VARDLVLYLRRPGSQAQFSAALAMQYTDRKPLRDLETWVLENLRKTTGCRDAGGAVAMSPRNLTRVFSRELDMSPLKFVERLRVEAARRRLEEIGGQSGSRRRRMRLQERCDAAQRFSQNPADHSRESTASASDAQPGDAMASNPSAVRARRESPNRPRE